MAVACQPCSVLSNKTKDMKKNLIAEIRSIPDSMHQLVMLSRILILLAGAIAILGVFYALSSDTEKSQEKFFVDTEGYSLKGERINGVTYEMIQRAYPYLPGEQQTEAPLPEGD